MTEQLVNAQQFSLAGNLTATATALVLNGANLNLPGSGTYRFLVDPLGVPELAVVISAPTVGPGAVTTVTVLRGQEGTLAVPHSAGALVVPIVTAGALAQMKADIIANTSVAGGVLGGTYPNPTFSTAGIQTILGFVGTSIDYSTAAFIQASDITQYAASMTVTGATNASPIVLTVASTSGLSNGNVVNVSGVLGNTAANGLWEIASVTATTLTLSGSVGNGTYTSGGSFYAADIDGIAVWNRIFTITNFGVVGGRVILEDLQHMNVVLQAQGLPPATSFVLKDSESLGWNWPNTGSVYGPSIELIGPGTANLVQLRSPSGAQTTRMQIQAFHGLFYSRGILFRGDPNAPLAGFYSVAADANIVLSLQSFWRCDVDIGFFGCAGTTAVCYVNGITGPNRMVFRFGTCGVAPLSSTRNIATGVFCAPGLGEDGSDITIVEQAGQIPQFLVPNKAYGLGPGIYHGEGEAAGVNSANGTIYRQCTIVDSCTVAMYIAPTAANTKSGQVIVDHMNFGANCSGNAATEGGAIVVSNCDALKLDRCTDNRNNTASTPLLAFGVPYATTVGGSGGTTTVFGPVKVIENQTPLYATTTVLPVTLSGGTRPSSMLEEFGNVMSWYALVAAGQSATVNLLATVAGNDNSSYAFAGSTTNPNPAVQTAPTNTAAQLVIGTFQATGAAGAYVPVARLNAEGVPVMMVNDGNASISAGTQVMPSPTGGVAGKVRTATSVTNGVGIASGTIPTTGNATGPVVPRAA